MKKFKDNVKQSNAFNLVNKKTGRALKDIIPINNSKHLRENMPLNQIDLSINNRDYAPFAEPFEIPSEWNEEEIKAIFKDFASETILFDDPAHDQISKNLPLSMIRTPGNKEIKWLRLEECLKNYLVDKEIKNSYPKKNFIKMRIKIRESFENQKRNNIETDLQNGGEDVDDGAIFLDDEESRKKIIYKEFFFILEKKIDFKIVNYNEREETDEEYIKRREDILNEKSKQEVINKTAKKVIPSSSKTNDKKTVTANVPVQILNSDTEKLKIKECKPSNISINEMIRSEKTNHTTLMQIPANFMLNTYTKWISSVFQIIKDLDICDAYTGRPIWYNIYPQKDNYPVYNAQGKYIVKLYFMGKPRKIEIDDKIPCSKFEEYIVPKSEYFDEIWPALLTKALLKLNMYKMKYPQYYLKEEVGDCSIIYALTGYIGQHLEVDKLKDNQLICSFENILSDEMFLEKKKYLICLNQSKENFSEDLTYENATSNYHSHSKNSSFSSPLMKQLPEKSMTSEMLFNPSSFNPKLHRQNTSNIKKDDYLLSIAKAIRFKTSDNELVEYDKKIENLVYNTKRTESFSTKQILRINTINPERHPSIKNITSTPKNNSITSIEDLQINKTHIFYDFAYSICELFDNNNFNMNRLRPLDFSDLKQKIKDAQVSYKQLTIEEKKSYIQNLVDLKNKQRDEKVKRIEELKKEGKRFNLIKLKNGIHGGPKMNFYIPHTDDDIQMAKKCLLNHWDFPPQNYFDEMFPANPEQEQYLNTRSSKNLYSAKNNIEDALSETRQIKNSNKNSTWNREAYLQMISHNTTQFLNMREPVLRQNGGVWVYLTELKKLFNKFIILHNPYTVYTQGKFLSDNNWYQWQNDIFEPIEETTAFHLSSTNTPNRENEDHLINLKNVSSLLIVFQPNGEKSLTSDKKISSYINLEIIDNTGTVIKDKIIMNSFFSTFFLNNLEINKDYFIIIKGGVFHFGYHLQLLSEGHSIDNMSHNSFLKKFKNFNVQNFKMEHPPIEKNKFYLFARVVLKCSNLTEAISVKVSLKYPDKYAKKFIELYCNKNKNGEKAKINFNEMIKLENLANESMNFYYFTVSIKCPFNLQENSFEIEFIHNDKDAKIEYVENIEPFEISDKLSVDRHGVIFKEFIYSSDIVNASFDLKLRKEIRANIPFDQIPQTKDKKINSSNNIILNIMSTKSIILEEQEITEKTRLYVELYKIGQMEAPMNKELLYKWECYNGLTIHHLMLEGIIVNDKPGNESKKVFLAKPDASTGQISMPYLLICYLDLNESPDYILDIFKSSISKNAPSLSSSNSSTTTEVSWVVRVFSSDSIGFVKDTTKEDKEKALVESWEIAELGRSEKAKKSRIRFLIQSKKDKGENISQEEEKILNEERERKTLLNVIEDKDPHKLINKKQLPVPNNAKKNDPKIIDKKNANVTKIPISTNVNPTNENIIQSSIRVLPKPGCHTSDYVKNFLQYTYQERTIVFDNSLKQTNKKKTKEIIKLYDDYEMRRQNELNENLIVKVDFSDNLKVFLKTSSSFRKEVKEDKDVLIKAREIIKTDMQSKIDLEKSINDFIQYANSGGNVDPNGLNNAISLYKEANAMFGSQSDNNFKDENIKTLNKKLFSVISNKKEENIKNDLKKLTAKDKSIVAKYIEDIETNSWIIDEEIVKKLHVLLK